MVIRVSPEHVPRAAEMKGGKLFFEIPSPRGKNLYSFQSFLYSIDGDQA